MQDATCNQCGASLVLSAKFCRQCGNRLDASEMTTRSLDAPAAEPPPFDHPTRPANAGVTSPTYAPQVMMPPQPPAPFINNAPPSNNKTGLIIFLALGLTVLIALCLAAFVLLGRFSGRHHPPPPPPPSVTEKAPPPPGDRGIIPHPPLPPPPPGDPNPGKVKTSLDPSLIYPGAEVTMDVGGGEGHVTQLQSGDAFDKVVDWYVEKLKPKNQVSIPGGKILESDSFVALITSAGNSTSIMLTRKTDK
jgi:hypothetical protein